MSDSNTWKHSACVRAEKIMVDNASLLEFPAGYHFDTHMHRTVEIFICLSGRTTITVQNVPVEVLPGEYMAVFPNVLHSTDMSGDQPCNIYQLHFHSDYLSEASGGGPPMSELRFTLELTLDRRKFLKGRSTPQLEACLSGIRDEMALRRDGGEKMLDCYMKQLDVLLSRDLSAHADGGRLYENRYLVSAALYINEHFMEKITVSGIAAAAGVSSRYLTRLFQEQMNLGVSIYVTYVRISKAIDYMFANPQYPLTALALDMGFSSQQHFSKVFKEKMGLPPKKYFSIRPIAYH